MKGIIIVGAGGHGRVVADAALESGIWDKVAFVDDNSEKEILTGIPIIGKINEAQKFIKDYSNLIVALGDNKIRVELLKQFKEKGFRLPSIIHPNSSVSRFVQIEEGSVIFAQAVVNPGAKVGFGSIINTAASVDHDCFLGLGVHLSPGVRLAGKVNIGNYSWLGVGTTVINNVTIGKNVIVGAGSVVISHIKNNVTVVGVPAKIIKTHKEEI